MAIKSWQQIGLDHIKNTIIRMGNAYVVIYFNDGSTITLDPNSLINELGYLNNDKSNKIDVSNDNNEPEDEDEDNQEEYDESDDEELFQ
jgi:hypothetical protein